MSQPFGRCEAIPPTVHQLDEPKRVGRRGGKRLPEPWNAGIRILETPFKSGHTAVAQHVVGEIASRLRSVRVMPTSRQETCHPVTRSRFLPARLRGKYSAFVTCSKWHMIIAAVGVSRRRCMHAWVVVDFHLQISDRTVLVLTTVCADSLKHA